MDLARAAGAPWHGWWIDGWPMICADHRPRRSEPAREEPEIAAGFEVARVIVGVFRWQASSYKGWERSQELWSPRRKHHTHLPRILHPLALEPLHRVRLRSRQIRGLAAIVL